MIPRLGHEPGLCDEDPMKRTEYFSVPAALLAAFVLAGAVPAMAQEAGIKSLDGKARAGGKVMTKDELRACMKQQDDLAKQRTDLETRREVINKEREAIQAENEALKTQQASVIDSNAKVKEVNDRMNAYSARVEAYNQGMTELNDMRPGPFADRKRRELAKEKQELSRIEAESKSESDTIRADLEKGVTALNARVEAQNKRATDWNTRNKALEEEASAYEDRRIDWKLSCGDRRYREDDEKAIRAGK
jgi:chromosome segregation ATPase